MAAGSNEFLCALSCPVSWQNAPAVRWKQQKPSEWVYDLQKTIECISLNMKKKKNCLSLHFVFISSLHSLPELWSQGCAVSVAHQRLFSLSSCKLNARRKKTPLLQWYFLTETLYIVSVDELEWSCYCTRHLAPASQPAGVRPGPAGFEHDTHFSTSPIHCSFCILPSHLPFGLLSSSTPFCFGSPFPSLSPCVSVIGHLNEKASNWGIRGACLSLSLSLPLCEWKRERERERETVPWWYGRQSPRDVLKNKSIWKRPPLLSQLPWLQAGSLCVFG